MQEKVKVQVVLPEDYAKALRLDAAKFLTSKYDELLQKKIPVREDYATDEEFKKAQQNFMLESIEFVSVNKHAAFSLTLNQYNELLVLLNEYEDKKKGHDKTHIAEMENCYKRNRRTFIATIAATLIYPVGLPAYLVIGAARNGMNNMQANYHRRSMIAEDGICQVLVDFRNNMFDLTDIMRTDFHQSKRELEELRERAKKGENIMPILLEMISPEKLSLPRVEEQESDKQQELFQVVKRIKKAIYE